MKRLVYIVVRLSLSMAITIGSIAIMNVMYMIGFGERKKVETLM
ncbi:hypothetical protein [Clostridium polynesiense]